MLSSSLEPICLRDCCEDCLQSFIMEIIGKYFLRVHFYANSPSPTEQIPSSAIVMSLQAFLQCYLELFHSICCDKCAMKIFQCMTKLFHRIGRKISFHVPFFSVCVITTLCKQHSRLSLLKFTPGLSSIVESHKILCFWDQ